MTSQIAGKLLDEFRGTQKKKKIAHNIFTHNSKSDLIEFYFTIFKAKMWKRLIFEWILLAGKKKKKIIAKIRVWEEKIQFKALYVFTLGPMTKVKLTHMTNWG